MKLVELVGVLAIPAAIYSFFVLRKAFATLRANDRHYNPPPPEDVDVARRVLLISFGGSVAFGALIVLTGGSSPERIVPGFLLALAYIPAIMGLLGLWEDHKKARTFNRNFHDINSPHGSANVPTGRKIGLVVSCSRNLGDYTFVGLTATPTGLHLEESESISAEIAKEVRAQSKDISIAGVTDGSRWLNQKTPTTAAGFGHICCSCLNGVMLLCNCNSYFCSSQDRKQNICPDCGTDPAKHGRQPFRLFGMPLDRQHAAGGGKGQGSAADDEFGFDENAKAWGGTDSTSGDREPPDDYAEMMRQAMETANGVSDARAEAMAEKMDQLAKKPGLTERTRQHYEMVAMLLRERAKGFKGRPDPSPPSDEEVRAIHLPAP
ncbi:hypothetical protein AAFN47_27530 [Hoeflea sp. CAU 1731]